MAEVPLRPRVARSDERFAILVDELLDRHRLAATDFSDVIVGSGKDAVAVVDGDFMKMLHQECFRRAAGRTLITVHGPRGVLSGSFWAAAVYFRVPFNRNLLVRDLLPDHATDDRRDFWKGVLNRTEKRIGLAGVRGRVLEYRDNNASLILGCDWRVPPGAAESGKTRPDVARRRALVVAATMIGALTMSRIVMDSELSAGILREAEKQLLNSRC